MQSKPIYNRDGYVLGRCNNCNRLNYVEPHGTTAACKCSKTWQEHSNIPYTERDISGMYLVGRNKRVTLADLQREDLLDEAREVIAELESD